MFRKKNYKQEDHFSQLYSFTAFSPQNGITKHTVYYKRYRQNNSQVQAANVYNLLNNKQQQTPKTSQQAEYPKDRTLELMSFDGSLEFLRKYLRKIGKIRKMEFGEGLYKGTKIWTAIAIFKFEFDLVKCFRDEYLQTIMNEQSLALSKQIKEDDRQDKRIELIHKHMGNQLSQKLSKLQKMKQGGFQVVTDIYGQYRFDYDANQKWVENLPQNKKNTKKQVKNNAQQIDENLQQQLSQ